MTQTHSQQQEAREEVERERERKKERKRETSLKLTTITTTDITLLDIQFKYSQKVIMASGLAAHIRSSTESDTFDLAGQNPSTITVNIEQAFKDPFPLDYMVRITFVTGAGKLGRQKYDDGCARAVTSTLRSCGFEEDRGASCVRECGGFFKQQHDTGKNLKTIVVFPNIREIDDHGGDGGGGNEDYAGSNDNLLLLFQPGSPEEMIALSPISMFSNLLSSRCPSWSQKKGCNAAIANIQETISNLEQRLMEGVALDDNEQALYDVVSVDDLNEKHSIVKDAMHKQIEIDGDITVEEQKSLLGQVSDRLSIIEDDLNEAKTEKKTKKVEKLTIAKTKVEQREVMLKKISPKIPQRLKHQDEILELRKELAPLIKLEDGAKGRLMSVKETQTLARKDEILEEITELEDSSRGWFEDDVSFDLRVKRSRSMGVKTTGKQSSKKTTSSTNAKKSTGGSAWVSSSSSAVRSKAKPYNSKVGSASSSSKKKSGGVFAAMMLDDSDSD